MSAHHIDSCRCSCLGIHGTMADPLRPGLHSHWKQGEFVDYTIKVDDREFRVHKLIMSSMSDYFQAMLTGGMAERGKDHVVIEGVSAEMVEILINFMYTNHMDINKENAVEILGAAIYFQINAAIKMCTSFMVENLDAENWFDVITLYRSYALKDAIKEVEKYVKNNMPEVFTQENSDHVARLPYKDFCFLLENWWDGEDAVYRNIQSWVKADLAERYKYYDDLLQQVRFCLMMPEELLLIKGMEQISDTPNCLHAMIDQAMGYHKLPLHQSVPYDSIQSRVRSTPSFLTFSKAESTDGGYFYGPDRLRMWTEQRDLRTPADQGRAFAQVAVNNFLIVNTAKGHPLTEQWDIFDPRIVKWEQMADLPRASYSSVLAHDKDHLYVVGGENLREHEVFSEIDQYDFKTDSWRTIGQLPIPLHAFGGCIYNNGLYIAGGVPAGYTDMDAETRSEMDRLDLSTGEWERKAPMLQDRRGRSMHIMKIFGQDALCFFEGWEFEYYSPADNQWSALKFSFSQPTPSNTYKHWIRWNTMFISDDGDAESPIFDPKHKVCVVTFPEDGTEAVVEYMPEVHERFQNAAINTVLSIAPYSCLLSWTNYQVEG